VSEQESEDKDQDKTSISLGYGGCIQLISRAICSSFARECFHFLAAQVACDGAAPVESTVALPCTVVLVCVIPPSAAHGVTTVRPPTCPIADSSLCSEGFGRSVVLAVARRAIEVSDVTKGWFALWLLGMLQLEEDWLHGTLAANWLHLASSQVTTKQTVTNDTELGQSDPTGPHCARPRHTMTLALRRHTVLKCLQDNNDQTHQ